MKINHSTLALSLIAFPFVSLPFLPGVYKPISIIPWVLISFVFILNFKKTDKFESRLILSLILSFFSIIIGFLNYGIVDEMKANALQDGITFLMGFLATISLYRYVKIYGSQKIHKYLFYSGILFVLIFWLELLMMQVGDKSLLIGLFSKRVVFDRIQVSTNEGAWASIIAIFYIFHILYIKASRIITSSIKLTNFLIVSNVLALLLTLSLIGYLVFLGTLSLYYIFLSNKVRNLLVKVAICIFLLTLVMFLFEYFKSLDADEYYLKRITNLINNFDFSLVTLISIDESMFVRIIYPLISIRVFIENLFFGVGLSGYGLEFNHIIHDYLQYDFNYTREVERDIMNFTSEPKFLIGKYLSFFGLGGVVYLILSISAFMKSIALFKSKDKKYIGLLFISVFLYQFNFGSFIFLQYILCLVLVERSYYELINEEHSDKC